jgi:hypothetical protein
MENSAWRGASYSETCEVGHSCMLVICHSWPHFYRIGNIILIYTWPTICKKNVVFWDVALCITRVHRRFGGTRVHRLRIIPPWRWRRYVPPKCRFTQVIHSATSQKTTFFIVSAVKASNRTTLCNFGIYLSRPASCISCYGSVHILASLYWPHLKIAKFFLPVCKNEKFSIRLPLQEQNTFCPFLVLARQWSPHSQVQSRLLPILMRQLQCL